MKQNRSRTLQDLEGAQWSVPDVGTRLSQEVRRLGIVPLELFTIEDLRLVIGQQRGLRFLVPIALERLCVDPFVEGAYYAGDLLIAVSDVDASFWRAHKDMYSEFLVALRAALNTAADIDPVNEAGVAKNLRRAAQMHGLAQNM